MKRVAMLVGFAAMLMLVSTTAGAAVPRATGGSHGTVQRDVKSGQSRLVAQGSAVTGGIPYDVSGVELGHVGEYCSFDAFLRKYDLRRPALAKLAMIIRGADTSRLDLTPQSAGLHAVSLGLSRIFADDHEMLSHGLVMYEALYAWCEVEPD
jgi:hypothetical protein